MSNDRMDKDTIHIYMQRVRHAVQLSTHKHTQIDIYTMELQKNKMMLSAAIWMDLKY